MARLLLALLCALALMSLAAASFKEKVDDEDYVEDFEEVDDGEKLKQQGPHFEEVDDGEKMKQQGPQTVLHSVVQEEIAVPHTVGQEEIAEELDGEVEAPSLNKEQQLMAREAGDLDEVSRLYLPLPPSHKKDDGAEEAFSSDKWKKTVEFFTCVFENSIPAEKNTRFQGKTAPAPDHCTVNFGSSFTSISYLEPSDNIATVLAQQFPYHGLVHAATVREIARRTVAIAKIDGGDNTAEWMPHLAGIVGLYHDIAHAYLYNLNGRATPGLSAYTADHEEIGVCLFLRVLQAVRKFDDWGQNEMTSPKAAFYAVMAFMETKFKDMSVKTRHERAKAILEGAFPDVSNPRYAACANIAFTSSDDYDALTAYSFKKADLDVFLADEEYTTIPTFATPYTTAVEYPDTYSKALTAILHGVHNGDMGHLFMKYGFCASLNLYREANHYGNLQGFLFFLKGSTYPFWIDAQIDMFGKLLRDLEGEENGAATSHMMSLAGEHKYLTLFGKSNIKEGVTFVLKQYNLLKTFWEENSMPETSEPGLLDDSSVALRRQIEKQGCMFRRYANSYKEGGKEINVFDYMFFYVEQDSNDLQWEWLRESYRLTNNLLLA